MGTSDEARGASLARGGEYEEDFMGIDQRYAHLSREWRRLADLAETARTTEERKAAKAARDEIAYQINQMVKGA